MNIKYKSLLIIKISLIPIFLICVLRYYLSKEIFYLLLSITLLIIILYTFLFFTFSRGYYRYINTKNLPKKPFVSIDLIIIFFLAGFLFLLLLFYKEVFAFLSITVLNNFWEYIGFAIFNIIIFIAWFVLLRVNSKKYKKVKILLSFKSTLEDTRYYCDKNLEEIISESLRKYTKIKYLPKELKYSIHILNDLVLDDLKTIIKQNEITLEELKTYIKDKWGEYIDTYIKESKKNYNYDFFFNYKLSDFNKTKGSYVLVDEPIEFIYQDKLNRDFLINNIYKELINLETEESFVFGLYGEWGEGKTSVKTPIVMFPFNKSFSLSKSIQLNLFSK